MAIRCGFFNSINGDRRYSAEEMNEPFKGIVSNGVLVPNEDSPTENSTPLKVISGGGLNVIVSPGRGIFADRWFYNDSDINIPIPANNGLETKISSIIVRIDTRTEVRLATIELITNNNNTVPAINTIPNVFEYRLATIFVESGVTEILQSKIRDTRATNECGWCHGLIKQLSTGDLFSQWETMFNDWFTNIQVSLNTQATLMTSLTSMYTTTAAYSSVIDIGIPQFNPHLDILEVYVNGLALHKGVDYTVRNDEQIVLTKSVCSGTQIMFRVFKAIDTSQAQSIVTDFVQLEQIVTDMGQDVSLMSSDTGWINFTLENGAEAYPGMTPAVRKVGKTVYLRGAVYRVSNPQLVICTLPEELAPVMEHYVSHVVGGTGSGVGYTTVRIKVNRNRANGGTATIALNGSTDAINSQMTIPISTSFVVG